MVEEKWISAGGVVLADLKQPYRIYVVKPSNNYGPWCFPKGRVDPGESITDAAKREVSEESGVPADILSGGALGTGVGSHSITHYFMMVQSGPVGSHDDETEEVRLVTLDDAEKIFKSAGNKRDIGILSRARAYLEKINEEVMTEQRGPLNELQVNLLGKIFFTACAAWLVGKATNMKVRGTEREINAVTNAMMSSRRFQDELKRPGATVSSVIDKLDLKHASAREFEAILGIPWPI